MVPQRFSWSSAVSIFLWEAPLLHIMIFLFFFFLLCDTPHHNPITKCRKWSDGLWSHLGQDFCNVCVMLKADPIAVQWLVGWLARNYGLVQVPQVCLWRWPRGNVNAKSAIQNIVGMTIDLIIGWDCGMKFRLTIWHSTIMEVVNVAEEIFFARILGKLDFLDFNSTEIGIIR